MKVVYCVIFFSAFSSIFAYKASENIKEQLLPFRGLVSLKEVFAEFDDDGFEDTPLGSEINAVINAYMDKIFKNINELAVKYGFDPVNLPDLAEDFLGVHIKLTNGSLHGFSTINRTNDALLKYSTESKILSVQFPIDLNSIYFLYHFHVQMLFVHIQGNMRGSIKDFKTLLKFSFDFNNYNATVDGIDTQGMGPISLTFDDKGLIADVINILSKFVTAIMHPLLEGIIRGTISKVCHSVVDAANQAINGFLHPNTTSVSFL